VVKSTGDGVLAIWDVPSQAVAGASQLRGDIAAIGLDDRGPDELKGIDGSWTLFALA
jgi:class 3 adenylate cyclase